MIGGWIHTTIQCGYCSHTSWLIHHSIIRLVAGRILQVAAILLTASSTWLGHRSPPANTWVLSPAVPITVLGLSATLGDHNLGCCCLPTRPSASWCSSCAGSSSARAASIGTSNRHSWACSIVSPSTTSWFPGHLENTLCLSLVSIFKICTW